MNRYIIGSILVLLPIIYAVFLFSTLIQPVSFVSIEQDYIAPETLVKEQAKLITDLTKERLQLLKQLEDQKLKNSELQVTNLKLRDVLYGYKKLLNNSIVIPNYFEIK